MTKDKTNEDDLPALEGFEIENDTDENGDDDDNNAQNGDDDADDDHNELDELGEDEQEVLLADMAIVCQTVTKVCHHK
jgi:hypothetical protein